mmetsp:Transcript_22831/g.53372  ORF Transcript_22831/g.53372 Transcript_22831/m.53372 type:complete len:508 (-) Transcript_22831:58-1581(-)|eukprot:CAMPEP_0178388008 /NCGR_PEP_ID=MMETSP0689_2-20121128/9370_1 /TAXON_ID=160604 /ORGANISM="Amphidinium massartii, Strain CS-259" /LENGTH=507 /DNA_ID=CAMNT_0020008395 /DNA_START=26 /DNA_END=1549 /DNA_ORIENTATION=-
MPLLASMRDSGSLSLAPTAASVAVALTAALMATWQSRKWLKRGKEVSSGFPQVPGLPFLGIFGSRLLSADNSAAVLESLADEYGKKEGGFEFDLLGDHWIALCTMDFCLQAFALRPYKMTRPGHWIATGLFEDEEVVGLFFAEGPAWALQRRIIAPAFNEAAVESYLPAVGDIIDSLMSQMQQAAASGDKVDILRTMLRFTGDLIAKVAFGHDLGAIERGCAELDDVLLLLDITMSRIMAPLPYWRIPGLQSLLPGNRAVRRLKGRMASLLEGHSKSQSGSSRATVLENLVKREGERLSHEDVVMNLIILFLAGSDTTATTLTWALYELARQPELQAKVSAEVAQLPTKVCSRSTLDAAPLVQAIWKETLRKHPAAPLLDVQAKEPVVIAGREIPVGTHVMLMTRVAFQESAEVRSILGDDLQDFRPERWLDAERKLKTCALFDSYPFGGGARICPGKALANFSGPAVLLALVQRFSIAPWEGPPMAERSSFVLKPASPVRLHIVPR